MNLRPVAAALILAALTCPQAVFGQGAWPQDCKLVRMAELPMTVKSNHVSISGSVNGKDMTLFIDTGGYASSLTRNAADSLGLVRHRFNSVLIKDAGGTIADEYVRAASLRIGGLQQSGVDLLVTASLPGVDGWIAPDILRNYDAEFDFGAKQFSLYQYHPCTDRAVYWTNSYTVVPFEMTQDGHVRVPVTLDGKATYAMIDTGAGLSVLNMQSARQLFDLDADSPSLKPAGQLIGGAGSQLKAYSYPFKTLTLGGVTVSNPKIVLTERHNFVDSSAPSMVLGMDVLAKLHLYIAYHEKKLYITDAQAH